MKDTFKKTNKPPIFVSEQANFKAQLSLIENLIKLRVMISTIENKIKAKRRIKNLIFSKTANYAARSL